MWYFIELFDKNIIIKTKRTARDGIIMLTVV